MAIGTPATLINIDISHLDLHYATLEYYTIACEKIKTDYTRLNLCL
jgi:hypothetical protein